LNTVNKKPSEIGLKQNTNTMEALLIINSILVAVCLYFIKDFHKDFKETAKKVTKLDEKLQAVSNKLSEHIGTVKRKLKELYKKGA
jgi:cell division protein ZapA (FtsZ GTPase activity inhibitor)